MNLYESLSDFGIMRMHADGLTPLHSGTPAGRWYFGSVVVYRQDRQLKRQHIDKWIWRSFADNIFTCSSSSEIIVCWFEVNCFLFKFISNKQDLSNRWLANVETGYDLFRNRQQSVTRTNGDPIRWRKSVSPGPNESNLILSSDPFTQLNALMSLIMFPTTVYELVMM